MNSADARSDIMNVINTIESSREQQCDVDLAYQCLLDCLLSYMIQSLVIPVTSSAKSKHNKKPKPIWNPELNNLLQDKRNSERRYRKYRGPSVIKCNLLNSYKYCCAIFDKRFRYYERQYKRNKMLYIEKLQTENPHVFWQQLRRLGPNKRNSIPMEIYNESNQIIYDTNFVLNKWKTDFENLYADKTKETKDLSDIIKNINYHIALIENNMTDPLYESNKKIEFYHIIPRS